MIQIQAATATATTNTATDVITYLYSYSNVPIIQYPIIINLTIQSIIPPTHSTPLVPTAVNALTLSLQVLYPPVTIKGRTPQQCHAVRTVRHEAPSTARKACAEKVRF